MKVLILSPCPETLIPAILANGDTVECHDEHLDGEVLASIRPELTENPADPASLALAWRRVSSRTEH
jgi:hypothetical protein